MLSKQQIFKISTLPSNLEDIPELKSLRRKGGSNYVSTSCNFYAIFMLTPYKFRWNRLEEYYELKTSKTRKILCALLHLISIIIYSRWLITLIQKAQESPHNLQLLFDIVASTGSLLLLVNTCFILWRKKSQLLDFVNQTKACCGPYSKCYILLLCSLVCGLTFLGKALDGYETIINPSDMLASSITSAVVDANEKPKTAKYTLVVVKWVAYVVHFACHGYISLCVMILVAFVLTLKLMGNDLMENLKIINVNEEDIDTVNWQKIQGLQLISNMRKIKESVDIVLSNSVLCLYVISLSNYGQTPAVYLTYTNVSKIPFFTFLIFYGLFWMGASEFHNTVIQAVKKWIYGFQDKPFVPYSDRMRLVMAANEIETLPICLSCKFFHVSYGFIGSMLGVIVTYAIVVFQLQTSNELSNVYNTTE